jgi:hypothetical protein
MPRIPDELASAFDEYVAGPAHLRDAIRDLDATVLNRRPAGEEWSTRDVVMHLADAEMVGGVRIRMVIASEDEPQLPGIDAEQWKRRLHYLFRDIEAAMVTMDHVRFGSAELLQQLSKDSWGKTGLHPNYGQMSIGQLMQHTVEHTAAHIKQIGEFRAAAE